MVFTKRKSNSSVLFIILLATIYIIIRRNFYSEISKVCFNFSKLYVFFLGSIIYVFLQENETYNDKDFRERKHILSTRCRNAIRLENLDTKKLEAHIRVIPKLKLIFCHVPKVASTSLKRMFYFIQMDKSDILPADISRNIVHVKNSQVLRSLKTYDIKKARYMIKHYKKLIFVRNPYTRLLSAYTDKFFATYSSLFRELFGKNIVKTMRTSNESDIPTFKEFLQYMVRYPEDKRFQTERHWMTAENLCRPCELNYDYIGKFETLKQDYERIFSTLNISRSLIDSFPTNAEMKSTIKKIDWKIVYKDLRIADFETFRMFLNKFKNDFEYFGYNVNF